jgi:KTSC domain
MTVTLYQVSSSYCDAIGHDPENNELHVRWPSGKVSIYSDMSAEECSPHARG